MYVSCYSKRWADLFPQHGVGPKHTRPIALEQWQARIAAAHPKALIRGMLHSDGCRFVNPVRSAAGVMYRYPRYTFSNRSVDVKAIFCAHLDLLEIEWRTMNAHAISIARRDAVARLDAFVGPKQ